MKPYKPNQTNQFVGFISETCFDDGNTFIFEEQKQNNI